MKELRLQAYLVAGLMFVGSQMAMAETLEVNVGGINYSLDSESMTATVAPTSDASGDIVLPQSVNYGDKAYALTSIGKNAFADCYDITSVGIPSGVTFIGEQAFDGCFNLASVSIPSGVTSIGDYAFSFCSSLTSVDIPSSVKSIGDQAFAECSELSSLTLNNGVATIGEFAFYECASLASVTIPSSVTSIGEYAFMNCHALESMVVEAGNSVYDSRSNCNAIIETATNKLVMACNASTIPYGVTAIGDNAFADCREMTSLTIPSSVTSIGDEAFNLCLGLTSVTIPSSVTSIGINPFTSCELESIVVEDGNSVYDSRNNCNAIIETAANRLISGCGTSTIPYGVIAIADNAFGVCHGLTAIDIPSTVTSIGEHAFTGCINLTSVKIPYGVTSIEEETFFGCGALTSVEIPSSVTHIKELAFDYCVSLASVTIPSSVVSIGKRAFSNCCSLKDVYCHGSEMVGEYYNDSFERIAEDATLHVDASLVDEYKSTSPWCKWFANIVALNGETGIGNISSNPQDAYRVYSVDGKELPSMQNGINILRSKSGKSVKVIK